VARAGARVIFAGEDGAPVVLWGRPAVRESADAAHEAVGTRGRLSISSVRTRSREPCSMWSLLSKACPPRGCGLAQMPTRATDPTRAHNGAHIANSTEPPLHTIKQSIYENPKTPKDRRRSPDSQVDPPPAFSPGKTAKTHGHATTPGIRKARAPTGHPERRSRPPKHRSARPCTCHARYAGSGRRTAGVEPRRAAWRGSTHTLPRPQSARTEHIALRAPARCLEPPPAARWRPCAPTHRCR